MPTLGPTLTFGTTKINLATPDPVASLERNDMQLLQEKSQELKDLFHSTKSSLLADINALNTRMSTAENNNNNKIKKLQKDYYKTMILVNRPIPSKTKGKKEYQIHIPRRGKLC